MNQTADLNPVAREKRIDILDSLRGFALLGILIMNIPFFSTPYQIASNPFIKGELSGLNYKLWWIQSVFFEGAMRGMFSMLFGAGAFLLLDRLEKRGAGLETADIFYRRTIWLIVFGMVNAFVFLWPGDILFNYGICGMFLFVFRHSKTSVMLSLIGVCLVIGTLVPTGKMYMAKDVREKGEKTIMEEKGGKTLSSKEKKQKKEWEEMKEHLDVKKLATHAKETKEIMQKGYFDIFGEVAGFNIKFESIVLYKEFFWDAMAFILIGILLFKAGFLTGNLGSLWYILTVFLGYGIGVGLGIYDVETRIRLKMDFTRYADAFGVSLYQFRRLALSIGHISLLLLMYKSSWFGWLMKLLANVGRMAFTNYLSQTLICITLFYGFGFGLFGELPLYKVYGIMVCIWIFQILFSAIWLRFFVIGPFEWVWRSLTYKKRQLFVKRN